MKKLLLVFLVLASIYSCGKSNSTSATGPSGLSSALSNVAGAVNLANAVNTNAFGANFAQLLSSDPYLTYLYYSNTTNNSNSNSSSGCIIPIGSACILGWDASVMGYSSATPVNTVLNGSVTVATKQAQLMSIINAQTSMYTISSNRFAIYSSDNKIYTIDTTYPIQANPIQIQDMNANTLIYLGYIKY